MEDWSVGMFASVVVMDSISGALLGVTSFFFLVRGTGLGGGAAAGTRAAAAWARAVPLPAAAVDAVAATAAKMANLKRGNVDQSQSSTSKNGPPELKRRLSRIPQLKLSVVDNAAPPGGQKETKKPPYVCFVSHVLQV